MYNRRYLADASCSRGGNNTWRNRASLEFVTKTTALEWEALDGSDRNGSDNSMADPTSLENDLHAIQALNQRHTEAVLANDIDAIVLEWSEDFTVLPPVGPLIRGRRDNVEIVQKGISQLQAFEPLEYVEHFEEIKVAGEYAFEWGIYRGRSRPRSGGDTVSYGGKLMRILQRQPDGSWKMYRTITTIDASAAA